jgi:hypothetical protein
MDENPNLPLVVCMNYSTPGFMKLQKRLAGKSRVQCRYLSKGNSNLEDNNEHFDAAAIDCSGLDSPRILKTPDADLIILDHINTGLGCDLLRTVLEDRHYMLLAHEPVQRSGYAIFRKLELSYEVSMESNELVKNTSERTCSLE